MIPFNLIILFRVAIGILFLVCINRNFSVLSHKRIKHQKIISLAPNGISTNEKIVNFHIMYISYQSQSRKLIQLFTLFSKEDGNKIKVHWRSEKRINTRRNKWLFYCSLVNCIGYFCQVVTREVRWIVCISATCNIFFIYSLRLLSLKNVFCKYDYKHQLYVTQGNESKINLYAFFL